MTSVQGLGAALGAQLGWLVTGIWRFPLPWFLPLEGRFEWATGVHGIGIDLFGRALWLFIGGVGGVLLGTFARSPRALLLQSWLVLVLFGLCLAFELVGS